jgi:hypothetical protein
MKANRSARESMFSSVAATGSPLIAWNPIDPSGSASEASISATVSGSSWFATLPRNVSRNRCRSERTKRSISFADGPKIR